MTSASGSIRKALWALSLLAAFGSFGFGQDIGNRCREIEVSIASKQRYRTYHSTVVLMSDKFDFYKEIQKRVREASAQNKVAGGLGAIIQQLDKEVLDLPEIGGRPKTNEKDLLAFQSRLTKLLEELMPWVADFDPGDTRDRVHRHTIEKYSEQIDDLRDEYAELKCGFLKKDPNQPTYPEIGGAWESNYKGSWNPTSITQTGKTLTFTNEFGDSSPGEFVGGLSVKATKWEGGLGATISSDRKTITWANGTIWRRK